MRIGVLGAALCLCFAGICQAQSAHASIRKDLNVPSEPLGAALQSLASTYEFQLLYHTELVKDLRSPGATGPLTPEEALTKVLQGTGLSFKYLDSNTVTVFPTSTSAASDQTQTTQDQGGGKKSSQDFRLAQVDQANAGPQAVDDDQNSGKKKKKEEGLSEIVVTGSRIPQTAKEGGQEVKVFTREQIEQSGQSTVSDFLNTLPDVAVSISDNNRQTGLGSTTVQLHGLPVGTTLVLINGRRVETSGAQYQAQFFDLNTIPLAAVERIEVLSEGSSAVYGSDAIAGVVNILLKKDFDGMDVSVKYGGASDTDETDVAIDWGKQWSRGSVSIIGSYQTRTELNGFDRSITANNNYTSFGGPDNRLFDCNPGNIFTLDGSNLPGLGAPYAAVPAGFTGTPTISAYAGTAGTLNKCSIFPYQSYIPKTDREGVFVSGRYSLTPSVELFTELMFSHVKNDNESFPPLLDGNPSFQYSQFTVPATNPFNPFGEQVAISGLLSTVGRAGQYLDTDFYRPLIGARGSLSGTWQWEVAAWMAKDSSTYTAPNSLDAAAVQAALNSSSPATALNPFVAGPQGSPQLLQSLVYTQLQKFSGRTLALNGFIRGSLADLPAGKIQVVLGGEYARDEIFYDIINNPFYAPNTQATYSRRTSAAFGEARIPVLPARNGSLAGDTLAVTLAGRYDNYNDFGSKTTPQFGVELRPVSSLLLRSTYSKAFRAPGLYDLYQPQTPSPTPIVDPRNGNEVVTVTTIYGGNPHLLPETGQSRTYGLVYTSTAHPDLKLSVTDWSVDESASIAVLDPQTIVNNENIFPGDVIRNSAGAITQITATTVNFSEIQVAGVDFSLNDRLRTAFGDWLPSLTVTDTYRYMASFQPGSPPNNRVSQASDDGKWAPRWKGTAALGWNRGSYTFSVDGRYVGRYQDYDSTREIGNFWLCDFNLKYAIGQQVMPNTDWLKGAYIQLGGVNVFNKLPEFSNFQFGVIGYDPAEADIRGRFLYLKIGGKW